MEVKNDEPPNIPLMPPLNELKWTWKDWEKWLKNATKMQNHFHVATAGRKYDKSDENHRIEIKILISAFGEPSSEKLKRNLKNCYSGMQRKIARKIRQKIQMYKDPSKKDMYLNVVYVMAFIGKNKEMIVPVFYFKAGAEDKYVDLNCRVYKDWNEFLKSNKIVPSLCCYPTHGNYGDTSLSFNENIPFLELQVYESPSCSYVEFGKGKTMKGFSYVNSITLGLAKFAFAKAFSENVAMEINAILDQYKINWHPYMRLGITIAISGHSFYDKFTHDEEYKNLIGDIALIISTVLNTFHDPMNKWRIDEALKEKKTDLIKAKYDDLKGEIQWFLTLFTGARCILSLTSIVSVLVSMLYKKQCTVADYFKFTTSLFQCYGIITSPMAAKNIFEKIKRKYIADKAANFNSYNIGDSNDIWSDKTTFLTNEKNEESKGITISPNQEIFYDIIKGLVCVSKTGFEKCPKWYNSSITATDETVEYCREEKIWDTKSHTNGISESTKIVAKNAFEEAKIVKELNVVINEQKVKISQEQTQNIGGIFSEKMSRGSLKDEHVRFDNVDDDIKVGKKAANDYLEKEILQIKNQDNEEIINGRRQRVRSLKTLDNIKDFICPVAFTKNTLAIKNGGVLLINGQLNIDGTAFAAYKREYKNSNIVNGYLEKLKTDEENGKVYESTTNNDSNTMSNEKLLMAETKVFNKKENNKSSEEDNKTFLSNIKNIDQQHRLTNEVEINEFEKMIKNLTSCGLEFFMDSIGMTTPIMTVNDYARLIHQFGKESPSSNYQGKIIIATFNFVKILKFKSIEAICACHQIILKKISNFNTDNDAKNEFLQSISDKDNITSKAFITETMEILKEIERFLIEKYKKREKTKYDNYLMTEDMIVIAIIAYTEAINSDNSPENQEEIINLVMEIINTTSESTEFILSQDGKKWIKKSV